MLCIRCEIASSMPTPPEDEDLRSDYQLSLLMTSMGQGRRADDHDWDAMLVEWVAIGAIAPEEARPLRAPLHAVPGQEAGEKFPQVPIAVQGTSARSSSARVPRLP